MFKRKPAVSTVIEESKRFSDSILWQLQRNYFSQQGATAWSTDTVPHYVTNNPYIAQAYARVMLGWLRDIADMVDRSQPVYIIELGAGSGRFGYHFMKTFFRLFEASSLADIPVTYVLTDFNRATRDFWKKHKQLKPYVSSGQLDFAKFDAEQDDAIVLMNQGLRLANSTVKNPIGYIANYFFDGLPLDIFHIIDGKLHDHLVTVTVPITKPNLSDPDLLHSIDMTYTQNPVSTQYYEDARWNTLLAEYELTQDEATFAFPKVGLACLQRLHDLSNGNMLMLTADRGFHRDEDFDSLEHVGLAVHGSFSMLVNYHAIGKFTKLLDGGFLSTPHRHATIDICGLLFGDADDYRETRFAYQQEIVRHNPDDFYTIRKAFSDMYEKFTLEQFLAYLRLSNWDERIFKIYYEMLMNQIGDFPEDLRYDFYQGMLNVWDMYYYIGEPYDVPFNIGVLLYGLDYYDKAIEFLEESLRLHGDHASTLCNMGMCYYALDQLDKAQDYANRALALDHKHQLSQELQRDIGRKRKTQ